MSAPRTMSRSRSVPVEPEDAFARTLAAPLPTIFGRWYGLLAPVTEVLGQDGEWGSVGQTRTIVQKGGSSLRETLVSVDRPRSFGYTLSHVTGPVSALVSTVDGEWDFRPVGTGTEITWRWSVRPASEVTAVMMPAVARMWQGYARQGLEELARLVVR